MIRPIVLAALLLAGCTPMQWVQSGVAPAQVEADLDQCGQLARNEAYYYSFNTIHDPFYWRFHGRPFLYDPFFHRINYERDLQDFCMRARGYHLEAVAEAS